MKALDELIAHKLPHLSAHLNALEADVSILATDWFLTLFAANMPSETVSPGPNGQQDQGAATALTYTHAWQKSCHRDTCMVA